VDFRLNAASTIIDDQKIYSVTQLDPEDTMSGMVYVQGGPTASITPTVDVSYISSPFIVNSLCYIILTQLSGTVTNV
jgi:hypothetical protein